MTPRASAFRRLAPLAAARDGAAAVEFAMAAPVFLLLLLGLGDIGHMAYVRALLNGAVEKAARSASLESGDTAAADELVKNAIKPVIPNAIVNTSRKSYYDFADVDRPEKFTDTNGDGACNPGEIFVDENRSGRWEADVGKGDNGGAGDVVIYTVTVTYQPVFSAKLLGNWNSERTITAVGVRKNQPFAQQNAYGSSAGTCT